MQLTVQIFTLDNGVRGGLWLKVFELDGDYAIGSAWRLCWPLNMDGISPTTNSTCESSKRISLGSKTWTLHTMQITKTNFEPTTFVNSKRTAKSPSASGNKWNDVTSTFFFSPSIERRITIM